MNNHEETTDTNQNKMSYLAKPQNHSQAQAIAEAKKGLMHFSECQDEGVDLDREFFATREEAEKSASEKTGYDANSDMEYAYEARSTWLDEDGDLIIADDEDETEDSAWNSLTE